MIKINKIILFFIGLTSFCSFANEDPCHETNGGATSASMCLEKKIELAQNQLKVAFNSAVERVKEEQEYLQSSTNINLIDSLNKAQKDWGEFKDNQCLFEGQMATSSPWQGFQIGRCKLKEILDRIEYLNRIFVG